MKSSGNFLHSSHETISENGLAWHKIDKNRRKEDIQQLNGTYITALGRANSTENMVPPVIRGVTNSQGEKSASPCQTSTTLLGRIGAAVMTQEHVRPIA